MSAAFIAVDWGTTNRRAFLIDGDGRLLHTERNGRGLLAIEPGTFAIELAELRAALGDYPVVMAGMVGSARGMVNVPYLPCPAGLTDLARALHWVEPGRTAIVPGLSDPAGDVMRGEEVQLLGAVAGGFAPPDALLCQPGTHCKWARMTGGRVAGFATAMTGELFALLRNHSLLADFLHGDVADGPAFRAGVAAGLTGGLTRQLFGVRAAALLEMRKVQDSAAYTSGLLIGHDVAAEHLASGQTVHILADAHLGALYAAAVDLAGGQAVLVDSHAAFVAGITAIWKTAQP